MDEVINKSDGQFKTILDDLVDYRKHVSKKDPLIKELSRPSTKNKPGASLNSSIYSSAASSSSSSSSSTSSDSSNSLSSSNFSSTSSSPSQSQVGQNSAKDYGKFETVKMEDLRKTAKILEHRLAPSNSSDPKAISPAAIINDSSSIARTIVDSTSKTNIIISNENALNTNNLFNRTLTLNLTAQKCVAPASVHNSSRLIGQTTTASSGILTSKANSESWKTISAKRDKKRRKPVEKQILAKEIPGHRGDLTVEELTRFIESGRNKNNAKSSKSKPQGNGAPTNGSSNHNTGTNPNNNVDPNNSNSSSITNKKNDINSMDTKSQQISSKTSNIQTKNPSQQARQSSQKQNLTVSQLSKSQSTSIRNQLTQNGNKCELKNISKLSVQQQPSKTTDNHSSCQIQNKLQNIPSKETEKSSIQVHCSEKQEKLGQLSSNQNGFIDQQALDTSHISKQAVTFAEHLVVQDVDIKQYTFGFFDEQSTHVQQIKAVALSPDSSIYQHTGQGERKLRLNRSEASSKSEESCYRINDNVDINSFNYEQILNFISQAWETTQVHFRHLGSRYKE